MKIDSLKATLSNRRGFTKSIGLASAGVAAFLANVETASAAVTDTDIVQFALNLEYLEAEFYTMAMTGQTLTQAGIAVTGSGNAGLTTGGNQVVMTAGSSLNLTGMQIMKDEQTHVTLLRGLLTGLGITPIAKPAINLNALGSGFESQEAFIALGRAFEDVGVSAYGGAAPLIQNSTILGYAARILAVEAEHTGNLRLHAALYLAATKPVDSQDILPPTSGTQYFSDNAQGLSIIRTPGQVLSIVYGGNPNGATSGGFFPNGVNGNINTSST